MEEETKEKTREGVETETAQIIKEIIVDQLGGSIEELTDERKLAFFKPDSLDVVEIIMEIEENTGVKITDEDAKKLAGGTIGDIIKYVIDQRGLTSAG